MMNIPLRTAQIEPTAAATRRPAAVTAAIMVCACSVPTCFILSTTVLFPEPTGMTGRVVTFLFLLAVRNLCCHLPLPIDGEEFFELSPSSSYWR
ncbi:hypothetical protein E2C01_007147 [Portunus trituberculatus]|uniref:Uncharacterized protein n=1 Tax=Portunus trituberculatus TaxID=210409 RepID=A0A5B7D3P1_PORTR|nr:hypothetical protein [Portunus trituberculatus]